MKIASFSLLLFALVPTVVLAQDQPLQASAPSWTARGFVYWGAPALAALLSLMIGVVYHLDRVKVQLDAWPDNVHASGSFSSLCGVPIAFTETFFVLVGSLFAYIYFASPETLDEWQAHQSIAWKALVISLVAAHAPWLSVTRAWRRS